MRLLSTVVICSRSFIHLPHFSKAAFSFTEISHPPHICMALLHHATKRSAGRAFSAAVRAKDLCLECERLVRSENGLLERHGQIWTRGVRERSGMDAALRGLWVRGVASLQRQKERKPHPVPCPSVKVGVLRTFARFDEGRTHNAWWPGPPALAPPPAAARRLAGGRRQPQYHHSPPRTPEDVFPRGEVALRFRLGPGGEALEETVFERTGAPASKETTMSTLVSRGMEKEGRYSAAARRFPPSAATCGARG